MHTEKIVLTRKKALELYRAYKEHQFYLAPIDQQIQRTYQLIAQGKVIIKAIESIKLAGLNKDGLPNLAIARADHQQVKLRMQPDGGAVMEVPGWHRGARGQRISFIAGSFKSSEWKTAKALVPTCPVYLRPKRGLANYHILWEAEWTNIVPRDPMLLRRIGGDMWLVVAAWDLTEVERAALATRLN
jgi:hypothetical protein